jgi:hypothetical protein
MEARKSYHKGIHTGNSMERGSLKWKPKPLVSATKVTSIRTTTIPPNSHDLKSAVDAKAASYASTRDGCSAPEVA